MYNTLAKFVAELLRHPVYTLINRVLIVRIDIYTRLTLIEFNSKDMNSFTFPRTPCCVTPSHH